MSQLCLEYAHFYMICSDRFVRFLWQIYGTSMIYPVHIHDISMMYHWYSTHIYSYTCHTWWLIQCVCLLAYDVSKAYLASIFQVYGIAAAYPWCRKSLWSIFGIWKLYLVKVYIARETPWAYWWHMYAYLWHRKYLNMWHLF